MVRCIKSVPFGRTVMHPRLRQLSVNSAKSTHLSNKWTPELESTCDLGSKTLFPTRSFTLEHRFAFDSRVPASSCVQYSRTAKLLVIAQVRCSRANEHVRREFLNRKSPKDSISGIHMLLRCAEHVRFVSVGSKLPLSGSTNMHGIWGTPLYTQNPPGGSRVLKGGEYGPIGGVCSPP